MQDRRLYATANRRGRLDISPPLIIYPHCSRMRGPTALTIRKQGVVLTCTIESLFEFMVAHYPGGLTVWVEDNPPSTHDVHSVSTHRKLHNRHQKGYLFANRYGNLLLQSLIGFLNCCVRIDWGSLIRHAPQNVETDCCVSQVASDRRDGECSVSI